MNDGHGYTFLMLERCPEFSTKDTIKIFEHYCKNKIITFNCHDGYKIKHGAFLDADVLRRALREAQQITN